MENKGKYRIRAFYRFVEVPNFIRLKKPFEQFCKANGMKGTILLAREGINATVSAMAEEMEKFWEFMNQDPNFQNMPFKESYNEVQPFQKMKIRLKREIVRMGINDLDISDRGEYVKGSDWDKLISDPEVVVVDTRNDYEYLLGSFEGALNPKTVDFRSFPKWVEENLDPKKHKKVAMFCTGGIRCEKSTAFLKQKGFEDVYHLEGGILQYFEDTKNQNKKWHGSCFVFDDRIAVNETLQPVDAVRCKKCGRPLKISDKDITRINQKGLSCEMIGLKCGEY